MILLFKIFNFFLELYCIKKMSEVTLLLFKKKSPPLEQNFVKTTHVYCHANLRLNSSYFDKCPSKIFFLLFRPLYLMLYEVCLHEKLRGVRSYPPFSVTDLYIFLPFYYYCSNIVYIDIKIDRWRDDWMDRWI